MRTKQIEESKTFLTNAFFNLLEKEEYDTISMSQIDEHAGVYRNIKNPFGPFYFYIFFILFLLMVHMGTLIIIHNHAGNNGD